MKSTNQILKWLALLFVIVASTMGVKAQGPYGNQGDQSVCLNSTQPYGVINNPNSTYTWSILQNIVGDTGNGTIASNPTNLANVNWTTAGNCTLQVIERNSLDCDGIPIKILITVLPVLLPGTISADQPICYNTVPAPLTSVDATGGNGIYTYQWDSSPDGKAWTEIDRATTAGYAPGALTATTYYRLHQTSGTCGTVITNTVVITIQPNLVAGTAVADQPICYNTVPAPLTSVNATGGNGIYTYQWDSSPNADDNTAWTAIEGAITSGYAPGALTATTYYRLHQTSGICGTAITNTVVINVLPVLTAPVISENQTICSSITPVALTLTTLTTGGNGTYTYQWQNSADGTTGWTDIIGENLINYAPSALTSTIYYHVIATATGSQTCGIVPTSNVVAITVNPLPLTSVIYHN